MKTAREYLEQKLPSGSTPLKVLVEESILPDMMDDIWKTSSEICIGEQMVMKAKQLEPEMQCTDERCKNCRTEEDINPDWLQDNHGEATKMLIEEVIKQLTERLHGGA